MDMDAVRSISTSTLRRISNFSVSSFSFGIQNVLERGIESKHRQTFNMIVMVIIPVLALIGFTTISTTSALKTYTTANKAKEQLQHFLSVSTSLFLRLFVVFLYLFFLKE